MSRFKPEGRKYHQNIGSSYMGAGRSLNSFTQKARSPFSKIKQIYGDHLESISIHYPDVKKQKSLSPELKEQIRAKMRASQRKVLIRQIIVGTLVGIASIILIIVLWTDSGVKSLIVD